MIMQLVGQFPYEAALRMGSNSRPSNWPPISDAFSREKVTSHMDKFAIDFNWDECTRRLKEHCDYEIEYCNDMYNWVTTEMIPYSKIAQEGVIFHDASASPVSRAKAGNRLFHYLCTHELVREYLFGDKIKAVNDLEHVVACRREGKQTYTQSNVVR